MIDMSDFVLPSSQWPDLLWEKFLKLSVAEYAFQGFLYLKVALKDNVRRKMFRNKKTAQSLSRAPLEDLRDGVPLGLEDGLVHEDNRADEGHDEEDHEHDAGAATGGLRFTFDLGRFMGCLGRGVMVF